LKNAVKALKAILNLLAAFVDPIAGGDQAKIESAGFEATADGSHDAVLPVKTENPKGISVDSVMDLNVKALGNATFYVWVIFLVTVFDIIVEDGHIILPANCPPVLIIPHGTHREKLRKLAKGKQVFIGVMAGNSAGLGPISAIVDAYTT
jgi:hypothetical protein